MFIKVTQDAINDILSFEPDEEISILILDGDDLNTTHRLINEIRILFIKL